MLVLARKAGEKVYIGIDIVVTVVASARGGVRLGFEAPTDVAIRREELVPFADLGISARPLASTGDSTIFSFA